MSCSKSTARFRVTVIIQTEGSAANLSPRFISPPQPPSPDGHCRLCHPGLTEKHRIVLATLSAAQTSVKAPQQVWHPALDSSFWWQSMPDDEPSNFLTFPSFPWDVRFYEARSGVRNNEKESGRLKRQEVIWSVMTWIRNSH